MLSRVLLVKVRGRWRQLLCWDLCCTTHWLIAGKELRKTRCQNQPSNLAKGRSVRVLRSVKVWELDPTSRAKRLRGLQKVGWPRDAWAVHTKRHQDSKLIGKASRREKPPFLEPKRLFKNYIKKKILLFLIFFLLVQNVPILRQIKKKKGRKKKKISCICFTSRIHLRKQLFLYFRFWFILAFAN